MEILYDFNVSVLVSTYHVRAIFLVKFKITTIVTIRHLVFNHPLIHISSLNSDLGHLYDAAKIHLNPLSLFQRQS